MRNLIILLFCMILTDWATAEDSFSEQDFRKLCDRIEDIRILPFKDEYVEDETYNKMLEAGDAVIPCLIERITDTGRMPDPRQSFTFDRTTVGDVAFWILLRLTGESLPCFLPEDVRAKWLDQGMDEYFRFVENPENRKFIQENLRQWLHDRKTLQMEEKGRDPWKCLIWEWPKEIRIKKIFEDPEKSGEYIAIIEVDKRARFVKEGMRFMGLEVVLLDGVSKCLLLKAIELSEEKKFCMNKSE